ncbi:MAG: glutamine-synthetase adenylyltransferase, partial [Pseudomonadota bacterium]
MRLCDNINQVPRVVDKTKGQAVVDIWGATGPLADLVRGAAGASPFLDTVLTRHADWLTRAVTADAPIFQLIQDLQASENGARDLRIAKQRVAGFLALAELARSHDILDGTARLTRFADAAVAKAFELEIGALQRATKLPEDTRWFVLAMGKMGAGELNFSSDIDIIVFLDDADVPIDQAFEMRTQMVKATRRAHKMLTDLTQDGFVFRTDL